jgi:hypothetical protein
LLLLIFTAICSCWFLISNVFRGLCLKGPSNCTAGQIGQMLLLLLLLLLLWWPICVPPITFCTGAHKLLLLLVLVHHITCQGTANQ